jgi:hypothetical protein
MPTRLATSVTFISPVESNFRAYAMRIALLVRMMVSPVRFTAEILGVPKSAVRLEKGEKAGTKRFL